MATGPSITHYFDVWHVVCRVVYMHLYTALIEHYRHVLLVFFVHAKV